MIEWALVLKGVVMYVWHMIGKNHSTLNATTNNPS